MFAERVLDIRAEIALEWAEILQEVKTVLIVTSLSMKEKMPRSACVEISAQRCMHRDF